MKLAAQVLSDTADGRPDPLLARRKIREDGTKLEKAVAQARYREIQRDIDRRGCVCQCADGNVIDPSSGDALDVFQGDTPAGFEFDTIPSQRHNFANLCGCHVVEKDNVNAFDLDESACLLKILSLYFDTDVWALGAKLTDSIGETRKASKHRQMIVFYEHHVVQAEPMVDPTPSDHSSLFKCT